MWKDLGTGCGCYIAIAIVFNLLGLGFAMLFGLDFDGGKTVALILVISLAVGIWAFTRVNHNQDQ